MLNWVNKKLKSLRKKHSQKRAFDAGTVSRLTSDWATSRKSADSDIQASLKRMVVNSRDSAQNSDYIKKFLRSLETNVIGSEGIKLQMQVKTTSGETEEQSNEIIETAWKKWGQEKFCSVDGKHTWNDFCRLFVKTVATDGECLIRKVKGFENPFGFSLQFIESDHLDEDLNKVLENGNSIRMGIEFDQWRRPVAYHLLASHPGEDQTVWNGQRYQRIPAEEIIHAFISDRVGQSRGVPWIHSAMTGLNLLEGYTEAELVHARAGASKMGVIITPDGEYKGDGEDADGKIEMETEPGVWRSIPAGTDFKTFDPTHPSGNYGPFVKSILRGVASGIGASYNSLASDGEGVNFSTMRQFALEERDHWRMVQTWTIGMLQNEVFSEWMEMGLTTQAVLLPFSRLEQLNKPSWRPRGWGWVDPVKDIKAAILAIEAGLNSRTRLAAEQGRDFNEILEELAREEKAAEEKQVKISANTEQEIEQNGTDNQDRQAFQIV